MSKFISKLCQMMLVLIWLPHHLQVKHYSTSFKFNFVITKKRLRQMFSRYFLKRILKKPNVIMTIICTSKPFKNYYKMNADIKGIAKIREIKTLQITRIMSNPPKVHQ
ncbi:hypothetical protein SCLARK_001740 [Spiroplasma clarkii]|uniref:Uncharacterized protein n=1 Tax=Spiroplasma clarkii TaxID=2139 RepID=A0A1Y0L2H9_9MOLU|nr:hypothetical protein [Spiroplasma clarkii]ARU92193.1 hypothetical protein SCLARK_001740 [Spiroplasma clarkii]ATX71521.1 hypothetical protein SCLAR_v1c12210 [Spiroplasma clarkii]